MLFYPASLRPLLTYIALFIRFDSAAKNIYMYSHHSQLFGFCMYEAVIEIVLQRDLYLMDPAVSCGKD